MRPSLCDREGVECRPPDVAGDETRPLSQCEGEGTKKDKRFDDERGESRPTSATTETTAEDLLFAVHARLADPFL